LLEDHSYHGSIATICTVSTAVARQHPKCGAAPAVGRQRRPAAWDQPKAW